MSKRSRAAPAVRDRISPGPGGSGETRVIVNGHDATDELRTETAGARGLGDRPMPPVREALVRCSWASQGPGLVADGATWAQ